MSVKTCATCKHFEVTKDSLMRENKCHSPDVVETDRVTGIVKSVPCNVARAADGACGEDGDYWQRQFRWYGVFVQGNGFSFTTVVISRIVTITVFLAIMELLTKG